MAEFCVVFKIAPSEYKKLTLLEYNELSDAYSKSKGTTSMEDFLSGF